MHLFLCPVCKHASPEFCTIRPEVQVAQEECEKYEYSGKAEWVFHEPCPTCKANGDGNGMIAQDNIGGYCNVCFTQFSYKKKEE